MANAAGGIGGLGGLMGGLSGRAVCLIRESPHYRREAFEAGLEAVGLAVLRVTPTKWLPGDVLVIWNRYARFAAAADACERAGGTVVVAENPYLGTAGERYAVALDHHKGPGRWCPIDDGGARWRQLGLTIEPWCDPQRRAYVLLAPERGIGPPVFAMPRDWPTTALAELERHVTVPVRLRRHPGKHEPAVPLAEDLAGAVGVVTWGSNVGLHALCAGIPVWYAHHSWIGASCSVQWAGRGPIGAAYRSIGRLAMFHRLAWAQWSVEEIGNGAPFRHLLLDQGQAQRASVA